MDIYELLKTDHDKVKKLLSSLEKKKDNKLFEELKREVILHNEAEEEAFYEPLQTKVGKLKIIVKAGHEDHDLVMQMIKQINKVDDDAEWKRLLSVIKKSLEAHILMEEEDIFDLSKKYFSAKEAREMADKMGKIKDKMAKEYSE